jgi:U3 small nucleolar ribonucleoprotein protein IMP4
MTVLTTSRKPGRRTRSFAKVIARYLNWKYINRGKKNLEEVLSLSREVCIIEEIKGNPAVMNFYRNGKLTTRIYFSAGNVKKVKMDDTPPVFIGKPCFDPLLFGAIPQSRAGEKLIRKVDFPKKIVVRNSKLYFYYIDELILTVKIHRIS